MDVLVLDNVITSRRAGTVLDEPVASARYFNCSSEWRCLLCHFSIHFGKIQFLIAN
jgi:hypothetical protein